MVGDILGCESGPGAAWAATSTVARSTIPPHAARGFDHGRHWTTDATLAREAATLDLMHAGQGAEKAVVRGWVAETKLHRGRFNAGQKAAVKTILTAQDRVLGVQGYAGAV